MPNGGWRLAPSRGEVGLFAEGENEMRFSVELRGFLAAVMGLVPACQNTTSQMPNFAADDTSAGEAGSTSETTGGMAGDGPGKASSTGSGTSGSDDDGGMPPVRYDVLDMPGADDSDSRLRGYVWAPNGEIPVSGALVYTTPTAPEGVPQHVYCAECRELGPDDHSVATGPDGSFSLGTIAADAKYLVVTKGQFMRVTEIALTEGDDITLPDEDTTLPAVNEPEQGLYIPRIAIGDGSFDRLEDALAKFGLGDTSIMDMEERLVPGTEPFDLYDNGRDPTQDGLTSQGTFGELVADPERLAQYHIIFLPCSGEEYLDVLDDEQNVQNIRDWVEAGGRWYVSDWSNEWLIRIFPEYQRLHDDGFGTDLGSYDALANILDEGLLKWLEAIPEGLRDINPLNDESHPTLSDLPNVMTVDNWSAVVAAPQVLVEDENGQKVNVGHKVWLEGDGLGLGVHPLTVTGQFGCGKIQFTSYHTAEFFDYVGLSPQELVLIYTILEIGTCQTPLPPPQG